MRQTRTYTQPGEHIVASRKLTGYRRPNGDVGIRNHVLLLPIDDISNEVCRAVAGRLPGARRAVANNDEMQYGADRELTLRTLAGTGANPNVAAVVVVGGEDEGVDHVAEVIAATGKPVVGYATWGMADVDVLAKVTRAAATFVRDASAVRREAIERRELTLSMKCAESDTTSALVACPVTGWVTDRHVAEGGTIIFGETSELTGCHDLLADRCVDEQTRAAFTKKYEDCVNGLAAAGVDLLGTQPTRANLAGGLTTIEEKSIGTVAKTGSTPIVGALDPALAPSNQGLNFMDTSSTAGECGTLMAAAGSVLHLFPCGGGNVIGHPIQPVMKISANPRTVVEMADHIDVDVSDLLGGDVSLESAGERLLEAVDAAINGHLTCAESFGHHEFTITRLFPSV